MLRGRPERGTWRKSCRTRARRNSRGTMKRRSNRVTRRKAVKAKTRRSTTTIIIITTKTRKMTLMRRTLTMMRRRERREGRREKNAKRGTWKSFRSTIMAMESMRGTNTSLAPSRTKIGGSLSQRSLSDSSLPATISKFTLTTTPPSKQSSNWSRPCPYSLIGSDTACLAMPSSERGSSTEIV